MKKGPIEGLPEFFKGWKRSRRDGDKSPPSPADVKEDRSQACANFPNIFELPRISISDRGVTNAHSILSQKLPGICSPLSGDILRLILYKLMARARDNFHGSMHLKYVTKSHTQGKPPAGSPVSLARFEPETSRNADAERCHYSALLCVPCDECQPSWLNTLSARPTTQLQYAVPTAHEPNN